MRIVDHYYLEVRITNYSKSKIVRDFTVSHYSHVLSLLIFIM